LSVKMAARAKKTNARGEESPDAELGAVVEEEEPVAEVVLDPVELDPEEVVLEPEEVLELDPLVVAVVVELPVVVLVTVATDEEPVEEEPDEVEDAAAVLEAPPINWNSVL